MNGRIEPSMAMSRLRFNSLGSLLAMRTRTDVGLNPVLIRYDYLVCDRSYITMPYSLFLFVTVKLNVPFTFLLLFKK